jgi:malonyl-CoA O-methyltransferase
VRTDVREVFAVAARAYDRGNPLLAVERPETQALLPPLFGRDVLDLGCGRGHYAALARASQAARVVALDLTPEMLEAAPPPAVIADACRLPLADGTFDVVIAALALSYVAHPARALREAARVLRPGGVIVASELHPVAAVKGWRRRFARDDGGWTETDAAPPRIDEWRGWLAEAGLHLEVLREPAVGPALEPHFRRARRRDFAALVGTPLLVVFRAAKGGRA